MLRRGGTGGLRRAVRSRPPRGPLLHWSSATFSNSSVRYIWDPFKLELLGPYAANVPATMWYDGEEYVQIEGPATNEVDDLGNWTVRGSVVRTAGQSDPAGGTGAYLFEGLDTGAEDAFNSVTGLTNSVQLAASVFVKRVSTSGVLYVQNPNSVSEGRWEVDLSLLPDAWERITSGHPAVTAINSFASSSSGVSGMHFQTKSGGPIDVYAFWPNLVEANYVTSPIPPSSSPQTRNADVMSFATLPQAMLTGAWKVKVIPYHASADLAPNDERFIVQRAGVNERLSLQINGAGTPRAQLRDVTNVVNSTGTDWSRNAALSFVCDLPGGILEVSGFDTNDGSYTGSSLGWTTGNVLRIGNNGSADIFDGLIGRPRYAP